MKPNLLLLDADVIIHLHECDLWKGVVSQYSVYVGAIVIEEVQYFWDNGGNKICINLRDAVEKNKIIEVASTAEEMAALSKRLKDVEYSELDPGELECATIIAEEKIADLRFCVKDGMAIKALTYLGFREQILSIETMLKQKGLISKDTEVPVGFSEERFNRFTLEATLDSI
ncbi:MAG: hypothetical protein KJ915_08965 [Candidatus Omnitrophica bacterium]|nr:hypothetical protein [Candidatus Omnitrophota bacterium]